MSSEINFKFSAQRTAWITSTSCGSHEEPNYKKLPVESRNNYKFNAATTLHKELCNLAIKATFLGPLGTLENV